MALMRINFFSEALGKHHHFNLILPEQKEHYDMSEVPALLPSVMILHGLSCDSSSYLRFTSVERCANEYNIGVILLERDHSFYPNMMYGHRNADSVPGVGRY